MNFKKLLLDRMSDDERSRFLEYEQYHRESVQRCASMDNETLANSVEYCLSQMRGEEFRAKDFGPGCPVYDAEFWHTYLPEMLRRLKCSK